MILNISGKIGSGKDTVARAIHYYIAGYNKSSITIQNYENNFKINAIGWKTVKFADSLKDIVCILTGCTREQLEDIDFKNSKLSDEWIRYGYADGFIKIYEGNGEMGRPVMNNKQCDKERYEIELGTNWQTAYKNHLTYRELLQQLGTNLLRNQFHEDVWVNALMSKYKIIDKRTIQDPDDSNIFYPNWIISDCRFPNEANAVKDKGGINIRVNRANINKLIDSGINVQNNNTHPSETALDNYEFDYIIDNNGTIEDLYLKVKDLLIALNLI